MPGPASDTSKISASGSSESDTRTTTGEPGGLQRTAPFGQPKLEGEVEVAARAVLLSTGAEYRKLPVDNLDEYEGFSVFYAAGPPEAQLCGAQRVGVVQCDHRGPHSSLYWPQARQTYQAWVASGLQCRPLHSRGCRWAQWGHGTW